MTNPLSRIQSILLSIVVIVAFSVVGWQLVNNNKWKEDTFYVTARFQDVNGLYATTRVHLRGVNVGEVVSVRVRESFVEVGFNLVKSTVIGNDSKVKITKDPISERIVKIVQGQSEVNLKEGDILEGMETSDPFEDLAKVTQKLNIVLANFDQAITNKNGTLGKLVYDSKLYDELTETAIEMKEMVYEIRKGEGSVGQVISEVKNTLASIKQNSDAVKSLPGVRNYIVDFDKDLIRPEMKRLRKIYPESDLFESQKASLTLSGKSKLKLVVDWLNDYKTGEIVICSVSSFPETVFAKTLTQKRSDAVKAYLVNGSVNRTGYFWWNKREIKSIGVGNASINQPEIEELPKDRTEIILFLPS